MKNLLRKTSGQRCSRGFTLVELVVVVAVVGVLGAVAVPKLVDVGGNARDTALLQVAGSLAAGSATNYAKRQAGGYTKGFTVAKCEDVAAGLGGGGLDADFTLENPDGATAQTPLIKTATNDCTLYTTSKPIASQSFKVYFTATDAQFDTEAAAVTQCGVASPTLSLDTAFVATDGNSGFVRADNCLTNQQI